MEDSGTLYVFVPTREPPAFARNWVWSVMDDVDDGWFGRTMRARARAEHLGGGHGFVRVYAAGGDAPVDWTWHCPAVRDGVWGECPAVWLREGDVEEWTRRAQAAWRGDIALRRRLGAV